MGVDPGSRCAGWGIVAADGNRLERLESGVVKLRESELHQRLRTLRLALEDVLTRHTPECMAVEEVFYARNVRSALVLAQARGVILLAAADHALDLAEYSTRMVKQAVVGYGNAEKHQVQDMVCRLLNIRDAMPADESDALAIAICHLHRGDSPALASQSKTSSEKSP